MEPGQPLMEVRSLCGHFLLLPSAQPIAPSWAVHPPRVATGVNGFFLMRDWSMFIGQVKEKMKEEKGKEEKRRENRTQQILQQVPASVLNY